MSLRTSCGRHVNFYLAKYFLHVLKMLHLKVSLLIFWFLIIEWFMLENTFESLSPAVTPALPWLLLNSVPRCHIYKYFEHFQRWQFYHFHEQPVPMLCYPLSEASFPNMQSEPPLMQLEAISSQPVTAYWG